MDRKLLANRERYAALRAHGICPRCKGDPAPGRVHCQRCISYMSVDCREVRRKRVDAGLCLRCGVAPATPSRRWQERPATCWKCRVAMARAASKGDPNRHCGVCGATGHNRQTCEAGKEVKS